MQSAQKLIAFNNDPNKKLAAIVGGAANVMHVDFASERENALYGLKRDLCFTFTGAASQIEKAKEILAGIDIPVVKADQDVQIASTLANVVKEARMPAFLRTLAHHYNLEALVETSGDLLDKLTYKENISLSLKGPALDIALARQAVFTAVERYNAPDTLA